MSLARIVIGIIFTLLLMQCSPMCNFVNMENAPKYGLHGKLSAKEGKGEELAKILLDASKLMATSKTCYLYVVSRDSINPNDIWVTEIWESKADHDNSLNIQGVRELITLAVPLLEGRPQKGQEMTIIGGLGIKLSNK